jgi:hypothetical protein
LLNEAIEALACFAVKIFTKRRREAASSCSRWAAELSSSWGATVLGERGVSKGLSTQFSQGTAQASLLP